MAIEKEKRTGFCFKQSIKTFRQSKQLNVLKSEKVQKLKGGAKEVEKESCIQEKKRDSKKRIHRAYKFYYKGLQKTKNLQIAGKQFNAGLGDKVEEICQKGKQKERNRTWERKDQKSRKSVNQLYLN